MKTTRKLLSVLLALLITAGMSSISAFADNPETLHGTENLNQSILQFKKTRSGSGIGSGYSMTVSLDRHLLNTGSQIDYLDWGYGDSNIFLIPRGTGIVSFSLKRTQDPHWGSEDVNRWWRWNSWVNNAASASGNANGMYANIRGDKNDDHYAIVKSSAKETHYIGFDPHSCFQWTGGGKNRANYADVYVDSSLALGKSAVLWSANGTDVDFQIALSWVKETAWVVAGDIGKHTIAIAERRDVVYDLNGGSLGTDTNDQRYICWTTGNANTSQLHDTISAPTRPGYIFKGWKCVANDGSSAVTVGQVYQPGHANCCFAVLSNVKFQAEWEDEYFYVAHVQNGIVISTPTAYKMADYQSRNFDLTALVPAGMLYGGYYSDSSLSAPSTVCGKTLRPQSGKTYYIREIPNVYLRPKNLTVVRTLRDEDGKAVYGQYKSDTYLVTALDSQGVTQGFYKEYGAVINGSTANRKTGNASVGSGRIETTYYLYDSIVVDNSAYGRANSVYWPEDVFGSLGLTRSNALFGCICYGKDQLSFPSFRFRPYYITADNVLVQGTVERTVSAKDSSMQKPSVSDQTLDSAASIAAVGKKQINSHLSFSGSPAILGEATADKKSSLKNTGLIVKPVPRKPDAELHNLIKKILR